MKTKIEVKLKRKTNPDLVSTIINAKKKSGWLKVADYISRPRRKNISLNLNEIEKASKENHTVVIPGKVLGKGELTKKIKLVAFNFSKSAEDKLKKSKIEYSSLAEEIKKNPEGKNIQVLVEGN